MTVRPPKPREPRCGCGHSSSSHRLGIDGQACDGGDRRRRKNTTWLGDQSIDCDGHGGEGVPCQHYEPSGGFEGAEWARYKARYEAWRVQMAALGWPRRRAA